MAARVVIIADDFSGAAELAGIAAARGMRAEVQTRFDPSANAEVIAVDTDTRLRDEAEAVRTVSETALAVAAATPGWIYKKTDSVLRGHARAEIEAVMRAAGLSECVFVPANPSKGRMIVGGRYSIEGVPLDRTVFATDPDYPRHTAVVRDLLGDAPRIRVPDVGSQDDLRQSWGSSTLAAGAADFFTTCLEEQSCTSEASVSIERPARHLLLCGSLAAWDMGRAAEMEKRGFAVHTIDKGVIDGSWMQQARQMLAIGRPREVEASMLMDRLMDAAVPLIERGGDLCVEIEGGATAMALLRRMEWTRFEVVPEGLTGVGSLRPPGGPLLRVKPGSYPWPRECWDAVES